jgi:hypothetical protein
MKVRIQRNSIRYRLRQTEVTQFRKYGSLTEELQLGNEGDEHLRFVLRKSPDPEITIQYSANTTVINVPEQVANQWADSEKVGFDTIIEIGNGKALKILVEKDFKCLHGIDEDTEDAYPNPNQTS